MDKAKINSFAQYSVPGPWQMFVSLLFQTSGKCLNWWCIRQKHTSLFVLVNLFPILSWRYHFHSEIGQQTGAGMPGVVVLKGDWTRMKVRLLQPTGGRRGRQGKAAETRGRQPGWWVHFIRSLLNPLWFPLLYSEFTGVPLENLSSIGTEALFKLQWSSPRELKVHWSSWGCSWTWPSCATSRDMSRSPNSWMRQCLYGELDKNLNLWFVFTQFHFGSILISILVQFWPSSSHNSLYKSTFS